MESITRDICEGGAFIAGTQVLPPRSIVVLEFRLDGEESPIRCKARVVWVNKGQLETFPPGFGVEFVDIDRHCIERLLVPDEEDSYEL